MVDLDRIAELIKSNGWSVSEFERRIGRSNGTFGGWRAGRASPDKHLHLIVAVLGTTEAYLRGETDDPALPPDHPGRAVLTYYPESNPQIKKLLQAAQELSTEEMALVQGLVDNMLAQKKSAERSKQKGQKEK